MPKTTIEISTSTIFRIVFIALVLIFLYAIRDILVLIFFALIIASAVDLPARRLDKLKIPRLVSVLLIYLVGLFSVIIVIVISFYLAVQKNGIQHLLKGVTPKEHEPYVLDLWARAQKKMGHWLQGQLFLAIVVGVLVYIGLSLLNIRFALLLAIIAGIFELVPYIGPVLAGVPAVILALFQAPILALWVLILYFVVQQLENYLLVPLVMKKVVGLNPVVVIIALLVGGKLLGILGILLAVPAAAVLAEFFKDFKRK